MIKIPGRIDTYRKVLAPATSFACAQVTASVVPSAAFLSTSTVNPSGTATKS